MDILIIVGVLILIWIELTGGFFAYTHMRVLHGNGVRFPWYITYPAYTFLVQFAILDILFNATWGTIIFREIPKELFFTSRVKRHYKKGSATANQWRDIINKIDPGHI